MKTQAELYEALSKIDLCIEGAVEKFEAILNQIGSFKDANSIQELSKFFNDESEYDEVKFSIVHLIESFDDVVYVTKLLEAIPELCNKNPRWALILFMRVLNSEDTRRELIRQLQIAPLSIKLSVRSLIARINEKSAMFLEKTASVLVATRS